MKIIVQITKVLRLQSSGLWHHTVFYVDKISVEHVISIFITEMSVMTRLGYIGKLPGKWLPTVPAIVILPDTTTCFTIQP